MKTTCTVNRQQNPEYVSGSKDKGYFVFSVQGVERRGASTQCLSIEGRAEFAKGDPIAASAARKAASKNAWSESRTWVRELGELARTDSHLTSERDD